jgi:hypothetical protein
VPAAPPEVPLELGEFVEVVLRGALRDPQGPGRLVALAERFLGRLIARKRWLLLTNRRLLLLRRKKPGRYRENDWYDAAFDRRNLHAKPPVTVGDMVTLQLGTTLGPRTIVVPARSYQEAARLARSVGG